MCIPKIPIIPNAVTRKYTGLRFTLRAVFAMTVNRAQGQVFIYEANWITCEQLHVACSRFTSALKIVQTCPNRMYQNMVCQEALPQMPPHYMYQPIVNTIQEVMQ